MLANSEPHRQEPWPQQLQTSGGRCIAQNEKMHPPPHDMFFKCAIYLECSYPILKYKYIYFIFIAILFYFS